MPRWRHVPAGAVQDRDYTSALPGGEFGLDSRERRIDFAGAPDCFLVTSFFDNVPPHHSEQNRWFADHVPPYEPMLRAWLRSRFSSDCEIDDIVQEAFIRMLDARKTTAIESPKAFLFATARNLALGRVRRRQVIGEKSLAEFDVLAILDEGADVRQSVAQAPAARCSDALWDLSHATSAETLH